MNDILMDSLSSIAPPGLQPAVLPTQVEAKEDPVSELNLMFQKKQLQSSPSYQFEKNGPDNNPTFTFTCTVLLNPMWVGGAEGGQLQQQQGGPAIKRTGNGTAKKKQDSKSAAAKSGYGGSRSSAPCSKMTKWRRRPPAAGACVPSRDAELRPGRR